MRYSQKYLNKKFSDLWPPIPEDERIYLNVSYKMRELAQYCHCCFDPGKKLWYTGYLNSRLFVLVKFYGIHNATSEKARQLAQENL